MSAESNVDDLIRETRVMCAVMAEQANILVAQERRETLTKAEVMQLLTALGADMRAYSRPLSTEHVMEHTINAIRSIYKYGSFVRKQ